MALDRRILEGLEACRPDSDDLLSPELDDVARRVQSDAEAAAAYRGAQAWDAAIGEAMEQVSVPAGLADRISQRLAAAAPELCAETAVLCAETAVQCAATAVGSAATAAEAESLAAAAELSTARPPWSRRAWLGIPAAIAAAVLVAISLGQFLPLGNTTPVEMMAEQWQAQLEPTWHVTDPAPHGFGIPPVVTAESTGWQRIGKLGGIRGVAYKLVNSAAGSAELFVVRLATAAPTSPPTSPQSTTGGQSIGYWRSGDLVYVLVVQGDERDYRSFVNSSRMPLA